MNRTMAALLAVLIALAQCAAASGMAVSPASATVYLGETLKLTASAADRGVAWASSDKAVARVDQNGLVTPVKPGKVKIACRTGDGATAVCRLTVTRVKRRALVIGRSSRVNGPEFVGGALGAVRYEVSGVARAMAANRVDGYPINVSALLNKSKAYVRAAIRRKFAAATERDVNYLYFSGHGAVDRGEFFMVPATGHAISATELRAWLDAIPGRFVVTINTCHGGAAIGKGAQTAFARGFLGQFLAAPTAKGGALAGEKYRVLCSSAGGEQAYTVGREDLFGLAYASGMGWDYAEREKSWMADTDGDRKITLAELYAYTRARVRELCQAYGLPDQTAVVYPEGGTEEVLYAH